MDHTDKLLAAALCDVPMPEGLADRISDRLNKHFAGKLGGQDHISGRKLRFPRRWLLVAGGVAATAVGFFLAVWLGMSGGERFSEQYVLDEAIRIFEPQAEQTGTLLAETANPASHPFSSAILQVRGTRWRYAAGFLGERAVVYDLPGSDGTIASLYVVEVGKVEDLGDGPAWHPFTTAGCCASAWREGGLLYVLVVHGDAPAYRAYLNTPEQPVA